MHRTHVLAVFCNIAILPQLRVLHCPTVLIVVATAPHLVVPHHIMRRGRWCSVYRKLTSSHPSHHDFAILVTPIVGIALLTAMYNIFEK